MITLPPMDLDSENSNWLKSVPDDFVPYLEEYKRQFPLPAMKEGVPADWEVELQKNLSKFV